MEEIETFPYSLSQLAAAITDCDIKHINRDGGNWHVSTCSGLKTLLPLYKVHEW
jgi:hypothetical protein